MTLDALRLEVPDIREDGAAAPAEIAEQLAAARHLEPEHGLQQVLGLLFTLNRSGLTLLERQRALQNFSDEYRHYAALLGRGHTPSALFVRLCGELAIGFKRLLLQILQGRQPSRPHLAWCLYMAQHFLAQQLLRHFQLYQEPPAALWRDSHLLYWIGDGQTSLYLINALVASFVILILFEPVRSWLENGINRWLLRQRTELRGRLEQVRRELPGVVDVQDMVDRITAALEESRRVTDAAVYLLDSEGAGYDRAGMVGQAAPERIDASAERKSAASRPKTCWPMKSGCGARKPIGGSGMWPHSIFNTTIYSRRFPSR